MLLRSHAFSVSFNGIFDDIAVARFWRTVACKDNVIAVVEISSKLQHYVILAFFAPALVA